MNKQLLTSRSQTVDSFLECSENANLENFLQAEKATKLEAASLSPSTYDLYVVRRNPSTDPEIFGPKTRSLGSYSESDLYGVAGSSLARFRSSIRILADKTKNILSLNPDEIEFHHQVTLFWAEMAKLKDFLTLDPSISEIISEFQTARFQFLKKDTPFAFIQSMSKALNKLTDSNRFDTVLVDEIVELMEISGFDSFAIEALRQNDG